jgi:indole-3-glycerol phosphate synthase
MNAPTVLDRIITAKRDEVAAHRELTPLSALRDAPVYQEPRRGFRRGLVGHAGRSIIAEIKRASPSRGPLRLDADAADIARQYASAGAAAISVLTDPQFFRGTLDDLAAVRRAVGVPLLRKDFMIDPYQVEEARAWGADAILVIVAATERAQRLELMAAADAVELDVLVEVHDEGELDSCLEEGASLIGINNRNLKTFETTVATSERLLPRLPATATAVCESGLRLAADMERLEALGARAFLIGEALIAAPSPGAKLTEFIRGT